MEHEKARPDTGRSFPGRPAGRSPSGWTARGWASIHRPIWRASA